MGKPVNVAIRVNGDNATGMGHVVECLSLAKGLRKRTDCKIAFITEDSPPAIQRVQPESDFLCILSKDVSESDEVGRIRRFCQEAHTDILVVDLLRREECYFAALKNGVSLLVAILDDNMQCPLPCDVVVNFHVLQKHEYYSQLDSTSTQYLVGSLYALLDESYHIEWAKKKVIPKDCRTIFINQGGSDPYGLTAKILRALQGLRLSQKVAVVVGPALVELHRREMDDIASSLSDNYDLVYNADPSAMRQLMSRADLAITGAGNTLYELAALGVPSVIVCHHERHNLVASHYAQRGAAVNLGIGSQIAEETISHAIESLLSDHERRASLSAQGKKITDGNGTARVAEALLQRVLR